MHVVVVPHRIVASLRHARTDEGIDHAHRVHVRYVPNGWTEGDWGRCMHATTVQSGWMEGGSRQKGTSPRLPPGGRQVGGGMHDGVAVKLTARWVDV